MTKQRRRIGPLVPMVPVMCWTGGFSGNANAAIGKDLQRSVAQASQLLYKSTPIAVAITKNAKAVPVFRIL